jgi:hypothetical protein
MATNKDDKGIEFYRRGLEVLDALKDVFEDLEQYRVDAQNQHCSRRSALEQEIQKLHLTVSRLEEENESLRKRNKALNAEINKQRGRKSLKEKYEEKAVLGPVPVSARSRVLGAPEAPPLLVKRAGTPAPAQDEVRTSQHYADPPPLTAEEVMGAVNAPTFPGCNLPVLLLDAAEACPRCGKLAREHKAWHEHHAPKAHGHG